MCNTSVYANTYYGSVQKAGWKRFRCGKDKTFAKQNQVFGGYTCGYTFATDRKRASSEMLNCKDSEILKSMKLRFIGREVPFQGPRNGTTCLTICNRLFGLSPYYVSFSCK